VSDLTAKEQANVRAAVRFLHARLGRLDVLAKALHSTKTTLRRPASASMAVRVARLAGVGVDDVLDGKYPPAGMCAHCGQRSEPAV
jgi:hypothetical protein